jgi:transcriptional regulator with XRE-family HTH domain
VAKPSPQHAGTQALRALGVAIRARRLELGISQEALAHDAQIDRSYLGGVERGEHNVAFANLMKIAGALKIKLAQLIASASL